MLVFMMSLFVMTIKLRVKIKPRIYDNDITPKLIKLAWPLSLESFVWIIYSQIDRLLIGYFLSPVDVGVYGAAWSIAALLSFIPQSFTFLALPIFSNFMSKNRIADLKTAFNKLAKTMFGISLPILICLMVLSKEVLIILYGIEYSTGSIALSILALGVFSECIMGPVSECLVSAGKTRAPLIATSIGCLINIILNILLIPKYGIIGAAVGTFTAMFLSRLVLGYFNYLYLRIFPINYAYFCWLVICLSLTPVIIYLNNNIHLEVLMIKAFILIAVYLFISYTLLWFIISYKPLGKFRKI